MDDSFSIAIKVRSYELDSFGHVNNAVYLNYLEFARCEYMQHRGLGFQDFFRWKAYPLVVRAEIDYKSPTRVDDELEIRGTITDVRRTSFAINYTIINTGTQKLALNAKMWFAFINEQQKSCSIPKEFLEKMIK